MKKPILFFFFLLFVDIGWALTWTPYQLAMANTAKNLKYLSQVEREAIMYINLARLYPKLFAIIEVKQYDTKFYGPESDYRKSLREKLMSMKPMPALTVDKKQYENAKCFAEESGNKGLVGHKHEFCSKSFNAECCSYGMTTGRGIALQWLIDEGVSSLGHREACLGYYSKIGLSVHSHKVYGTCAVADFI